MKAGGLLCIVAGTVPCCAEGGQGEEDVTVKSRAAGRMSEVPALLHIPDNFSAAEVTEVRTRTLVTQSSKA